MAESERTESRHSRVGIVVIGRNEGNRLKQCLKTVLDRGQGCVYVDSGSKDDSVGVARRLGAEVIELDPAIFFSAARARNEGFEHLLRLDSCVEYVQFIDGDVQLDPDWISAAVNELDTDTTVASVCGRLREVHRNATIYNRLCDMEWDGAVGEIESHGGIFMVRATAFEEIGGMNPRVIAAEDDELCVRLRLAGWKLRRLDQVMGLHDAAMTRFRQWWRRSVRCGHAYGQVYTIHRQSLIRPFQRQIRSVVIWGAIIPATTAVMSLIHPLVIPPAFALYGLSWVKVYLWQTKRGYMTSDAALYATSCVLGKLPELFGLMAYLWASLCRKQFSIIEHR